MAAHLLLSAAARTLSLKTIFSEGEDAAYRRFRRLRWPETDGAPVCPVCSCRCPGEVSFTTVTILRRRLV